MRRPAHLQAQRPRLAEIVGDHGASDSKEDADGEGKTKHDPQMRVQPGMVHFGGFTIGKQAEMDVRVTNTAAIARRLTVGETSTRIFRLRNQPRGPLAPGMSELITVVFTPEEYK